MLTFWNWSESKQLGLYRVKSLRIWSFPGCVFWHFGLNTENYSVNFRIQSEYGKIRTRKISNTNTFHAALFQLQLYNYNLFPVQSSFSDYFRIMQIDE